MNVVPVRPTPASKPAPNMNPTAVLESAIMAMPAVNAVAQPSTTGLVP